MSKTQGHVRIPFVILMALSLSGLCDCGFARDTFPPKVIAYVNGEEVSQEEFRFYLELKGAQFGSVSKEGREDLLKQFAVDMELAKEARARGLEESETLRYLGKRFDWNVLPELYFREEFLEKVVLEEKDFEPYFQGLMEVADLKVAILASEDECKVFLADLKNGASFEHLVLKYSLGNSAQKEGLVPEVSPGDVRFTQEEKDAIFSAEGGSVAGPFANKIGSYSVIKVLRVKSIEDRKREIREARKTDLKEMKAATAYLLKLNEEMVNSEIEINEGFFEGKTTNEPGRPYLAWVKGQYIYPQDLGVDFVKGSHSPRDYRGSLDKLIKSVVSTELAKRAGIDSLPEYRVKRKIFIMSQVVPLLMEKDFVAGNVTVTDKEMEKYYNDYYKPDVYSVWVVLNRDRGKVEAARKEIIAGGDPSPVAHRYSDDASRLRGGVLGYLPVTALDKETAEVVSSLEEGNTSRVFETNGKFAIVRVVDKKTVPVPRISDVKDSVRNKVLLQKRATMVEKRMSDILKGMSLRIDHKKLASLN